MIQNFSKEKYALQTEIIHYQKIDDKDWDLGWGEQPLKEELRGREIPRWVKVPSTKPGDLVPSLDPYSRREPVSTVVV